MLPQKLHQQNEDANEKSHQKQRKKTFKYVDIDFFESEHILLFIKSNKITSKSSIIN